MGKLKIGTTCSGIGMQERGVYNSGCFDEIEVVATSETDINAIMSYAAIHNGLTMDVVDNYTEYPERIQMATELAEMNIGYDWKKNKPYDWQKVARGKDTKKLLERTWLSCKLNRNLGDMCKIKSFPTCDLFTYSTPCTDYSIAGKQEGTKVTCHTCGKDFNPLDYDVEQRYSCPHCGSTDITSTRSGLMVEIERIILDMVKENRAPKYLLQENVDALVSKKFIGDFENWIGRLDKLGYNTYWTVMNTKYVSTPEIPTPQNRKRVFSLSIRKDVDKGTFTWPQKFDSGIRLKDILFDEVDEKYYITNEKAEELKKELILNGSIELGN